MDATDRFDPYYTWLGIRPEEQPPDHYRLLGIARFEGNAEVIEHAADRQMTHLRSLQTGKYAAQGQQILNQISKARICLLDPRQKGQYDQMLAAKLALATSPAADLAGNPYSPADSAGIPTATFEGAAASFSEDSLDFGSSGSAATARGGSRSPTMIRGKPVRHKSGGPSVIAAVLGGGVALAIVYFFVAPWLNKDDGAKNPKNAAVVAQNPSEAPKSNDPPSPSRTEPGATKAENPSERSKVASNSAVGDPASDGRNKAGGTSASKNELKEKPTGTDSTSDSNKKTPDKNGDANAQAANPANGNPQGTGSNGPKDSGSDTKGSGSTDEPKKNPPPNDPSTPISKDDLKPSPPRGPSRAAIPADAAREKAENAAQDLFSKELASAKKPSEKAQLAGTLLSTAADLGDDLNGQYVLAVMARDLAIAAGDVPLAIKAVDRLAEKFEIDAVKTKSDVLTQLSETATLPSAQIAIVDAQLALADDLADIDDYSTALAISRSAYELATKTKNASLLNRVKERGREVAALSKEQSQFNDALKTLQTTPDDPAANTAAAHWFFFAKQEPEKSWPYFAKGTDASLKELAAKELNPPAEGTPQKELADAWWTLGHASTVESEKNIELLRALFWYNKASQQLTGLYKQQADKRIGELKPIADRFAKLQEKKSAIGATAPLKRGLYAEYFEGRNFGRYLGARVDLGPVLSFADDRASAIPSHDFSIRWTGYLVAQKAGNYRIRMVSKDGSRLWVNGKSVIDNWKDVNPTGRSKGPGSFFPPGGGGGGGNRDPNRGEAVVALGKQPIPVKFEYYFGRGEKHLSVTWELEGDIPQQAIPPQAFQHEEPKKGAAAGSR